MTAQKVSFFNSRGLKIVGILEGEGDKCVIISSHFTGFKEVKHYFNLAKTLSDEGICALRFDFSDCIGESEGKCEEMSVTNQTIDIISAVDFLEGKGICTVGIMGHSLGGLVAINAAANDNRIKALVSAAAPAKLEWVHSLKKRKLNGRKMVT
ncbi:MAG TPA: alpha/beta hydrolase [Methanofastidiosum sp.]|nr:alpha/beta hydrolase [Methanofastidiosum sp.]HNU61624.1 alpha/beta hydrolase [Methanofastidiosum sp.]HOI77568.1 alpha/beta hydrolase [Methanofastidiosum sp.]